MSRIIVFFIPLFILFSGQAAADEPLKVICVPWYNSANAHQTWSGKEIILKGTVKGGTGTLQYRWDFGDGKPAVTGTVIDPYAISATHTYTGSESTIFIANLIVTDGQNNRATDTYRVKIREAGDVSVQRDVAVDNALWFLHTQQSRLIKNGTECGYWQSSVFYVSPTSAAIEAFGNTGRLPGGDRDNDPYIETVERGFNDLWTRCKAITIGTQTAGNPDTNGNGIGIGISGGEPMYEIGQMMLAIVGSRQPERITMTGPQNVINRTYRDNLQDMVDYCAWTQCDNVGSATWGRGGWRYKEYNNSSGIPSEGSDNSATQWPVIGLASAETEPWNIFAPQFVKDELDIWLNYSQDTDGGFGYASSPSYWKNCAKTGAGICDLAYLGYSSSTPRVTLAIKFLANHWYDTASSYENFGNLYAMYSIMKAARVSYLPLEQIGTHTWYTEYSDYLLAHQYSDGHWETGYLKDSISPSLATAWGTLILINSLFSAPPVAVADVFYPQIPIVGAPVTFTGTRSYHLDPKKKIVKFEWDFENNDSIDAEGSLTTHTYSLPGVYSVLLRVTDDANATGEDIIKLRAVVAPATVTISPGSVTISVSKTTTLTAVVKDGLGNLAEDGTVVNWSATLGSITSSSTTLKGSATATYFAPTQVGTGTISVSIIGGENPTADIMAVVTHGTIHHFNFDPLGTQTAGMPFTVTVTAMDTWNNPVLDFKGTVSLINLTAGTITPNIITNFKDGKYCGTVAVFNVGTLKIKADFSGKTGTSNQFTVQPNEISYLRFDKIGTQTAGIGFRVNIVAYDNWGNTATTFLGSVRLSVEPGQSGTFSQGKWSGTVTIKKSGTTSITAMFNDKFGTSNSFLVRPNNLDYFTLGTITTQVSGVGFPITITAYDTYGNIAEYSNIAYLEDTTKTIQPTATTNFKLGIWLGTVSISAAGTTAIKSWSGTKTGLSNVFHINPADLAYITVSPKILELTVDNPGTLTAQGYDGQNNEVLNFGCDWEVTSNIGYFNPEFGSNTVFTAGQSATQGVIKAFVGDIFDTASVTIHPGSLSSIVILPNATTTVVTGSKTFTAQGYDRYGNEVVISGNWQVVNGLGTLTHLAATVSTFIAGTKTGSEILEYEVDGIFGTAALTLIPDVLDHFTFEPIGTQVAGQEFEITITVCDKYGNVVTGFGGFATLSDTSKTILPEVISRLNSGIWIGKVYIIKAIDETRITISAEGKTGISVPFKVEPSIVNCFKMEPISTQLCRQAFTATVTAFDIYSNIADYYGSFTLTDTTNSLNKTCNFTAGTSTETVALSKPMPDVQLTATGVKTTKSNPFFVLIDHTKDEILKEENIAVEIKPHFLPDDYYPIMIKNPTDSEITTANYYTDKEPTVRRLRNMTYRIEARNEQRELLTDGFGTGSAILIISYEQDEIDKLEVKEASLRIYELKNNRWVPIESSQVNADENNVSAPITQLGTYIIIGAIAPANLSNFVVYPNPFKPIRGDDKITFEGLPANTTIRIYDISGNLIRCIENTSAVYEWDVKDSYSKDVASGVYIYLVTSNDEKKTGKLAIVR